MLPKLPASIDLPNVFRGSGASGRAGLYARDGGSVTVSFTGADGAAFQVLRVATFDVDTDPDSPPGRPPMQVLVPSLRVDGPGPIDVAAGQAVLVDVQFTAPDNPDRTTFGAAAVLAGIPVPNSFPVTAHVFAGTVDLQCQTDPVPMLPSARQDLVFLVTSSLAADVNIEIDYVDLDDPSFSAAPQPVFLPGEDSTPVEVTVTILSGTDTPPGLHVLRFRARNAEVMQEFSTVSVSVTVTRTVQVTTNLPDHFPLKQAQSIRCALAVTSSGGPAEFDVGVGPLPAGITVSPPEQSLGFDGTAILSFDIEAFPDAPLGPSDPFDVFWTVKEPQIDGRFAFTVEVLSNQIQSKSFHQDVLTPAGTALGGAVDITLRSDGSFSIDFHVHDSGLPDYDVDVRALFVTPGGLVLAARHAGHVEGTVSTTLTHAPDRDSNAHDEGFQSAIRDHWDDIVAGRLVVTKEYSATGLIGFIEDVAQVLADIAATVVGGALGLVIGLGREIGQVFDNLGLGATFGIIAGVVVFAVGGSLVLAVAAGGAVGAITNALIKQRPMRPDEAGFAALVFGGSLPPAERIWLTNLAGLGGRAFTMPGVDGNTIYVNLGDAFDNPEPMQHTSSSYPAKGQVLIHELTHAWQIQWSTFIPGFVCAGIVNQTDNTVGHDMYDYPPPGADWSTFNAEQQGAIVDQWFGGTPTNILPVRQPTSENDPYFRYIRDNIRPGRP